MPVEGTGGRLRLTDVADVMVDHQPLIGDAVVDGGDGPAARRREVPRRQHARGHRAASRTRSRSCGRASPACRPTRRSSGRRRSSRTATDNLTARDRHRRPACSRWPSPRCCSSGARCWSALVDDPALAGRGGARARRARRDVQRDLASPGSRSRSRSSSTTPSSAPRTSRGACARRATAGSDRSTAAIVLDASARGARPAGVRDADRPAGDRAGRRHGGPAGRLLRAARARLRARGRRRAGRRAHASRRRSASLLFARGEPGAARVAGPARAAPALRRRARALRAPAADRARRRGRAACVAGARRAAASWARR